jgi:hypothetical protein
MEKYYLVICIGIKYEEYQGMRVTTKGLENAQTVMVENKSSN